MGKYGNDDVTGRGGLRVIRHVNDTFASEICINSANRSYQRRVRFPGEARILPEEETDRLCDQVGNNPRKHS
jgi:hypothetical protein